MHQYRGKLILHTGSMFSGKTSSLWKDLNRFKIAQYRVKAFKPSVDRRYSDKKIVSHDNSEVEAVLIETIDDVLTAYEQCPFDVCAIDEIQFLQDPPHFFQGITSLLDRGVTILLAGLDLDSEAKPFEMVKEVMPYADYLYKHHAVCAHCGSDAWVSHRRSQSKERIVLGAEETYEPLCRRCYNEVTKDL